MEILQLRYFYTSSKNENFSKTAKIFGVPTTSVSSSIRRLEKELGCELFNRTYNRISLNEKGKHLQQALCIAFSQLDKAVEDISSQYQDKREIRILVRGMRRKVINILSEFNIMHPNIVLNIAFEQKPDNAYDIIIDDAKDCYSDCTKFELYSMRLRLKCSSNDSLCQKRLTMSDLCNRTFVSIDQESNMNRILTEACIRSGFHPNIVAFCNDIECHDKLVAMGIGLGIGKENPVSGTSEAPSSIIDLKVSDFNEHYTVYVYYQESDYFGNIKKMVDFLKENSQ